MLQILRKFLEPKFCKSRKPSSNPHQSFYEIKIKPKTKTKGSFQDKKIKQQ
jgi:hypothetical protein